MQWDDVRILLALLRARNLYDASVSLGLDRSTLSRRLAALERQLGAALFVRSRDGMRATPAAARLRPHAERMEAEMTALTRSVAADGPKAAGVVRVAATGSFAPLLVREGLLELRHAHPELVVEVIAGNQPLDLARGEADVAVRLAPLRQAALRARRVARVPIGLFAAPAYLAARGHPHGPAALDGHDVVLPSGELARMPEARWLAAQKGVRVAFRSNSMDALVAAAVAGHGIVPLGVGWGEREPPLRRLFVPQGLPTRDVWVVTHEGSGAQLAVRVVVEHVTAVLLRAFGGTRRDASGPSR